ncbi:MAG: hypothetical protein OXJ55_01445, partial [Caldilineaceae bacterium]|nr:hypothetical protein [Caldilineaceae bacterium]
MDEGVVVAGTVVSSVGAVSLSVTILRDDACPSSAWALLSSGFTRGGAWESGLKIQIRGAHMIGEKPRLKLTY